jgi:hypothetical protein
MESTKYKLKNNKNVKEIFGIKIPQEIHFICHNNFYSNGWI